MSTFVKVYPAITSSIATLAATVIAQNSYVPREDNRAAITIDHTGSSALYVSYGTVATTTSYTARMVSGDKLREELYKGPISFIHSSTTGSTNITTIRYPANPV